MGIISTAQCNYSDYSQQLDRCYQIRFSSIKGFTDVNREVELEPPAFCSSVLANSNMKWARASLGWLGSVGVTLVLPLFLAAEVKG